MLRWRIALTLLLVGPLILGAGLTSGQQNYPSKLIRIVTSPPGGGGDTSARLIAQGISGPLGQPVIIENRPASVGIEIVAKAQPDGYSLLYQGNSLLLGPLLQNDPLRTFSAITTSYSSPRRAQRRQA